MTTTGPEPQEYVRELILTGELEQFNALMELEAGLSYDLTFRDFGRTCLCLLGPIVHGASICWLLPSGRQPILSSHSNRTDQTTISWGRARISVTPDMTLQQIYDRAVDERLNLCRALHLGLLRAIPLPGGRLRLLFAVAGFVHPPLFWLWVDGLAAELDRLGFHRADSAEASPGAAAGLPPRPEEPQPVDPLDWWFDWRDRCRALGYRVTLYDLACRTSYSLATIKTKHSLYIAEHRP